MLSVMRVLWALSNDQAKLAMLCGTIAMFAVNFTAGGSVHYV